MIGSVDRGATVELWDIDSLTLQGSVVSLGLRVTWTTHDGDGYGMSAFQNWDQKTGRTLNEKSTLDKPEKTKSESEISIST